MCFTLGNCKRYWECLKTDAGFKAATINLLRDFAKYNNERMDQKRISGHNITTAFPDIITSIRMATYGSK